MPTGRRPIKLTKAKATTPRARVTSMSVKPPEPREDECEGWVFIGGRIGDSCGMCSGKICLGYSR
jgi:hypothetical protein